MRSAPFDSYLTWHAAPGSGTRLAPVEVVAEEAGSQQQSSSHHRRDLQAQGAVSATPPFGARGGPPKEGIRQLSNLYVHTCICIHTFGEED